MPIGATKVTHDAFEEISEKFINLIIFKFLEKTKNFVATDNKLYFYTLFEMFENPFEIIQFFLNEIEYLKEEFQDKYKSRKLYLLDNFDNLANKSLNIFKSQKTHMILKKIAKSAQEENGIAPFDPHIN